MYCEGVLRHRAECFDNSVPVDCLEWDDRIGRALDIESGLSHYFT